MQSKTLLCILGPTAVGKTALAIRLAKYLRTEIISADSRQFYREISIGTAKPNEEELAAVPHHLIGHLSIEQTYSAGDFEREALNLLQRLFGQHDTVIAVGGSGLYVKALIEGLDDLPPANEPLRKELDILFASQGIQALQERLTAINPAKYQQTEAQNPQRLMRAIEIAVAEQAGFTPRFSKQPRPFRIVPVVIDLPREALYTNINDRVDHMIKQGLVEEARAVMPHRHHYALQTVGYNELFAYFDGTCTLEQAIADIKQYTRNFAKRQLTWFRKEAPAHWFTPHQDVEILELLLQN